MNNNSVRVSMSPVVAYIINSSSISTALRRYKVFKALANNFKEGDTFISDDLKDVIDYMGLGAMIIDMNKYYRLNIVTTSIRRGRKIYDANGKCIGKTSCNVYQFNANPEDLKRELSTVPTIIAGMFG